MRQKEIVAQLRLPHPMILQQRLPLAVVLPFLNTLDHVESAWKLNFKERAQDRKTPHRFITQSRLEQSILIFVVFNNYPIVLLRPCRKEGKESCVFTHEDGDEASEMCTDVVSVSDAWHPRHRRRTM